jgi:hypothetical protein
VTDCKEAMGFIRGLESSVDSLRKEVADVRVLAQGVQAAGSRVRDALSLKSTLDGVAQALDARLKELQGEVDDLSGLKSLVYRHETRLRELETAAPPTHQMDAASAKSVALDTLRAVLEDFEGDNEALSSLSENAVKEALYVLSQEEDE